MKKRFIFSYPVIAAILILLITVGAVQAAGPGDIITIAGGGIGDGGTANAAPINHPESVAVDGAGNLYIADRENHRIRKVTAATGSITTVAGNGIPGSSGDNGAATSARLNSPSGVAVDNAGNLYIADINDHRIRKVAAATGIITTVAGSGWGFAGDNGAATTASLYFPSGLTVDGAGNLYIADTYNHRIRKVDAATGIITTLAGNGTGGFAGDNGAAASASLNYPNGVAIDGIGNLYVADTYNHRIRKVDAATGIITTLAGNGTGGFAGDNGSATSANLAHPRGVVVDVAGNLFIADTNNDRIRKVDAATGIITTVMGTSTRGYSGDNGAATTASLNYPYGVAVDGTSNIYIADSANNRIRRVVVGTGIVNTVAGNGTGAFFGDNGAATLASLFVPYGVTVDGTGNLYIADKQNQRIGKVDVFTGMITTVAGNGTYGYSGDNGAATSARLNSPSGVAVDGDGNLYLTDTGNHRIRKVAIGTGIISTVAGNGTGAFAGDNGAATSASLYNPSGVAVDSSGIYIADSYNHRIRKVDTVTGIITTVAGNGTGGFAGDNVAATSANLNYPSRVAIDGVGNIYVADTYNHRIRKVDTVTGIITTVAGNGTSGYLGDNVAATSAMLSYPDGVTLDAAGNLFVGDSFNNRIRKVDVATAIITTIAGNGTHEFAGDSGAATSASLNGPRGIAVDESDNLYIADSFNNRIRMVIASSPLSPASPTATSATSISTTGFTANWNASTGATGYRLDVAQDSGFTSLVPGYDNLDVGNVTVYTVSGLSSLTTYYYRIRAYNTGGTSVDSNTIGLTTLLPAPNFYVASLITATGFIANWQWVIGANGYRLDVATDSGFTSLVTGYNDKDVNNPIIVTELGVIGSISVTGLTAGTTYYYRVRAYNTNVGVTSGNSTVFTVRTSADTGTWSDAGNMTTGRIQHTATLLPNGKVLVAGGDNWGSFFYNSTELYDPAGNTWNAGAQMSAARSAHAATLLQNGKILVSGGYDGNSYLASAELYNPATDTWMSAGTLGTPRGWHTATLLANGKVLIVGGSGSNSLASAELYDPATDIWSAAGSPISPRTNHAAVLLPNGKVLVAGGYNNSALSSVELYDPATNTWSATGSLATGHWGPTTTLLSTGKVLLTGGYLDGSTELSSAELYDPAAGTWSSAGSMAAARVGHTATLLGNGKLLIAGGHGLSTVNGSHASAEIYDPTANSWTATAGLSVPRTYHTATMLVNGKVLVSSGIKYMSDGGGTGGKVQASSEIYSSSSPDIITPSAPGNIEAQIPTIAGQLITTWTKPADADFSHIHIYRSTVAGTLGILVADNVTGLKYTDTGLASQTRYYYTVRSVDTAGNESTNTIQVFGTTLDITPPAVPTNISATFIGPTPAITIAWTKPTDTDFSHIHIYRSTVNGTLGPLTYDNLTTTSKTDTGLENGATYYYTIRAVDKFGNETTNTQQVSATVALADVTGPGAVSNVTITFPANGDKSTLTWTNPGGDFAIIRIYRSTASGQKGTLVYQGTATTYTDSNITPGSTYWYTLDALDTAGNITAYTAPSIMPLDSQVPGCIAQLKATPLADAKIKLSWLRSPSTDANLFYDIYADNGSGTISETSTTSTTHPVTEWTSATLVNGTTYQYTLKVADGSANTTTSCATVAATAHTNPSASGVSAAIKIPYSGKKYTGNQLQIMAEQTAGLPADLKEIEFQYYNTNTTTWDRITPTASTLNPDITSPYFIHWDVTGMTNGDYKLRAVAFNTNSDEDLTPGYITITLNKDTPDVTQNTGNSQEAVNTASGGTVSTSAASITIPAGTFTADATVTITTPDPATKAATVPTNYDNAQLFHDITTTGTTNPDSTITVELPYPDTNGDLKLDTVPAISVLDLKVCRNISGQTWSCLDSTVDTTNKTVRATTTTLGLMALLVPPVTMTQSGYNMASVALTPSNSATSSVFGGYVLDYNPTTQAFFKPATIQPGHGYFIWGARTLKPAGTEITTAIHTVAIKKGWNVIGNPYKMKLPVQSLTLNCGTPKSITQSELDGEIVGTFFYAINGAYELATTQTVTDTIDPWKGYWLLSDKDCDLIFTKP